MPQKLSYCADLVRGHDRPRFWLALFAPESEREGLFALYALNTELSHLRSMVSEEMIGHIRYAWWREALEGLFENRTIPGHPVLEELQKISARLTLPLLLALLEAYAATYPAAPEGEQAALDALCRHYLKDTAPGWHHATAIAATHKGGRFGLLCKLFFAGIRPR